MYTHYFHNSNSVVHSPEMSDACWVEVRSEKNGFVAFGLQVENQRVTIITHADIMVLG